MKHYGTIAAAMAALSIILSACGGSPTAAPNAAPKVDAAATKASMEKEAMAKEAMVSAESTKEAMTKAETMKKEEMVKADATKEAMAMADATKVAMEKETMVKADATKEAMAMADATKVAMEKEAMVKADATAAAGTDPIKEAMAGEAMMLAKGEFTKVDASHFANGQASIDKTAAGKLVLRFSNFVAADGPDLYVHLSGNPEPRDADGVMGNGNLDLGKLKQGSGDQEYELPADFDASKFKSVVIYCKRFSVVFSTATLAK